MPSLVDNFFFFPVFCALAWAAGYVLIHVVAEIKFQTLDHTHLSAQSSVRNIELHYVIYIII